MTRNQEMAIKLLQMINQDDDATVEYSSNRDVLNFWSHLNNKATNISIYKHHSDILAEQSYQKIVNEINQNRRAWYKKKHGRNF